MKKVAYLPTCRLYAAPASCIIVSMSQEPVKLHFHPENLKTEPTPYILTDHVVDDSFYAELERDFPSHPSLDPLSSWFRKKFRFHHGWVASRMSTDLFRDDTLYQDLLSASPAWRRFYDTLHSDYFIKLLMDLFGSYMNSGICRTQPEHAHYEDFLESRELFRFPEKYLNHLAASSANPSALFTRLDFGISGRGYFKERHRDWPNRLFSFLMYFSDADQNKIKGGQFQIWDKKEDGTFELADSFRPKRNRGILILNTPNSYHSVSRITSLEKARRSLYIAVSAQCNIWKK